MGIWKMAQRRFHQNTLNQTDTLIDLTSQTHQDNWQAIQDKVTIFLRKSEGRFSTSTARKDQETMQTVFQKGSREIREALNELAALRPDEPVTSPPGPFLASLDLERNAEQMYRDAMLL
jgi:hypothetical protein